MRVLIIGGDRRMIFVNNYLKEKGYTVDTLGLLKNDKGDIKTADMIILPVPVTRDKVNINCVLTSKQIPLDILKDAKREATIFGGGKLNLDNYTDYLAKDEYAIKNAVLTAEGAISYAIDNTEFSLWKSRILVVGYGRLGKVLADRIKGFSPHLTVSARNERDFATLDMLGINHIKTEDIGRFDEQFDIIFNTVDIKLNYKGKALFIDLSSSGGVTDVSGGLKYIKLPGVPSKTAPQTAGKIIAETVISLANVKGE